MRCNYCIGQGEAEGCSFGLKASAVGVFSRSIIRREYKGVVIMGTEERGCWWPVTCIRKYQLSKRLWYHCLEEPIHLLSITNCHTIIIVLLGWVISNWCFFFHYFKNSNYQIQRSLIDDVPNLQKVLNSNFIEIDISMYSTRIIGFIKNLPPIPSQKKIKFLKNCILPKKYLFLFVPRHTT